MTPPKKKAKPTIGQDYLADLYRETTVETKDPQPLFILHRDTIRTFLHEKISWFALLPKMHGLIGVEITIVAVLFTATFRDILGINGKIIFGVFVTLGILCGYQIIIDFIRWLKIRRKSSVDLLTDELGSRGSQIKPRKQEVQHAGIAVEE